MISNEMEFIIVLLLGVIGVAMGVLIGERLTGMKAFAISLLALALSGAYTWSGTSLPNGPLFDTYKLLSNLSLHLTPLGITAGIFGGVLLRNIQDAAKAEILAKLKRWQDQLERDKRRSTIVQALDLIQIGDIYRTELKDSKAGLQAYDRAANLIAEAAGAHIHFGSFWEIYAACLDAAGRKDEAEAAMVAISSTRALFRGE